MKVSLKYVNFFHICTWIEMMISVLARTPEYVFQDNVFDSEHTGPPMEGIRSLIA